MNEVLSYYSLYFVSSNEELQLLERSSNILDIDNITTSFENSSELATHYHLWTCTTFVLKKELLALNGQIIHSKDLIILYNHDKEKMILDIANNHYSINPLEQTYYWFRNMSKNELKSIHVTYQQNIMRLKKEKVPN